jgi:hypothetical protein
MMSVPIETITKREYRSAGESEKVKTTRELRSISKTYRPDIL